MATKRSAPPVHPSRQEQVPNEPKRKKQKPNNAGPKSFKKAHTVNELKSQVRSLKRLLERNDGLPATVKVEKERALQTAQHDLQKEEQAKQRSDMIAKYHKIRFFDRQKATKRLKRARKKLNACEDGDDERMRLEQALSDAEVDVNYAQYFPLDQPYVSLFPRKESGSDDGSEGSGDAERKGDDSMWQKVKQCMADGTLDALRNGRLREDEHEEESAPLQSTVKLKKHKVGKVSEPKANGRRAFKGDFEDGDDESDGGFFE